MTRKEIIDGLKMTMDLIIFDPSTGEDIDPDDLNDLNRTTYDACKGAVELLEAQEKIQLSEEDATFDCISRQAAINGKISIQRTNGVEIYSDEAVPVEYLKALPSAQPEPKSPLYYGDGYSEGKMVYDSAECPNCGYIYDEGDQVWGEPYCPHCGQALDWYMRGEQDE